MVDLKNLTWKLMLVIGTICCVSGLQAAPVLCSTNVTTAADFAALGINGCQFGNLIYYNFTYSYANDASPAVSDTDVQVQFSNAGGNPLLPVVSFLAGWDAQADDITDIRIGYSVAIALPPLTINAANMTLTGNVGFEAGDTFGGSVVSGAESVFLDNPGNGTATVNTLIGGFSIPTTWQQYSNFSGNVAFAPETQITISKDILLSAGDALYPGAGPGADDATVSRIDQGLSLIQGPEPVPYISLGGGLVAIAFLMRKRTAQRGKL